MNPFFLVNLIRIAIRTFDRKNVFTVSCGKKKTPGGFISELKLRSTSSTVLNVPHETTRIASKDKENLEICPFLKTR